MFLSADVIDFYKEHAAALEIPFSALMRLALKQFMIENKADLKNKKVGLDIDGQFSLF
jgi:hypothetical protein